MRFERQHFRSLGRQIRGLREARNWSLRRLSNISGVSVAAIQKIEAGAANPSLLSVITIIESLGGSIDKLIAATRKQADLANVVRGAVPARPASDLALSAALTQPRMNCRVITLGPREVRDDIDGHGPLFAHVLDGGLRLVFDKYDATNLSTGDSFHVSGQTSARWSNPLSRRSLVLCITEGKPTGYLPAGKPA